MMYAKVMTMLCACVFSGSEGFAPQYENGMCVTGSLLYIMEVISYFLNAVHTYTRTDLVFLHQGKQLMMDLKSSLQVINVTFTYTIYLRKPNVFW